AGGPAAYLAGRAAPFGRVGAGVVVATFYNFHPALVAEHIPGVWDTASPETVLRQRLRITDAYLTRLLGNAAVASPELAEAAALALRATEGCARSGRPLYSANADLPVPEQPHLALWHATTLLREHRGDGHLIALAAAGLGGLEALVTHTATGTNWKPSFLQATRGWSPAEWAAAQERLRERGLLDAQGGLTEQGRELRRAVEADTDRLDLAPYLHLGAEGTRRLTELAGALAQVVLAGDGLPLRHIGRR
ncbi:MAG: hypothetical protein ABIS86_14405, partial [Streptosporangiaceae bacterium]